MRLQHVLPCLLGHPPIFKTRSPSRSTMRRAGRAGASSAAGWGRAKTSTARLPARTRPRHEVWPVRFRLALGGPPPSPERSRKAMASSTAMLLAGMAWIPEPTASRAPSGSALPAAHQQLLRLLQRAPPQHAKDQTQRFSFLDGDL